MATDGMHLTSEEIPFGHHDVEAVASGPDTAQAHIGDLSGELFPQHPKTGFYFSAKGDACDPWELAVLESTSEGDSRHQAPAVAEEWQKTTIVSTPVTTGPHGGTYNSDLPNH